MQHQKPTTAPPQYSVRSLKNIISTQISMEDNNRVPLSKYTQQKPKMNDKNLSYFDRLKSMIGNPQSQYKRETKTQVRSQMNTIVHEERTLSKNIVKGGFSANHQRSRSLVSREQKKTQPSQVVKVSRRRMIQQDMVKNIKAELFDKNREFANRTVANLHRQKQYRTEIVNYKKFTVVGSPEMVDEDECSKWGKMELREVLGSGANARVRLGMCHQLKYAVKIYEKYKLLEPKKKKRVYAEIETLRNIPDHPNVIALHQSFEDKRQIHMIFEHLEGAITLQEYFRNNLLHLDWKDIRKIFIRVAKGIAHLHHYGIAHRDIKPENILISFDQDDQILVKIIDFGFATSNLIADMHCGTPNFMAPELLQHTRKYNPMAVDMWALGVTLFYLCEGRYPFKGYDQRDLFRSIRKGVYEVKKTTSSFLISIYEHTMAIDPTQRISAKQLTQTEWFYSE